MKTGTYGWKSVFAFTFRQTAKSKAFKVSSVIIIVLVFAIALLAGVLPALIGSRSTSDDGGITVDGETLVGTVYFADTTGITTGKDYESFLSGLGVKINDCGKDADIQSLTEKVKGENKSLLIVIRENKIGYDIYASRPGDESVSSGTANSFGETFKSVFDSVRLSRAGLTDEQIAAANKTVSVYQSVAGEPTENDFGFVVKMVLPMLSSLVLFMLIFIYGQMVAQSIAQEKTSKVMELLLTSVRPLAIIIGKILAMGSLALIQFMMIIASGVLGIVVSTPLSSSIIGSSEETGAVTSQLMNEVGNALGGFFACCDCAYYSRVHSGIYILCAYRRAYRRYGQQNGGPQCRNAAYVDNRGTRLLSCLFPVHNGRRGEHNGACIILSADFLAVLDSLGTADRGDRYTSGTSCRTGPVRVRGAYGTAGCPCV